MVAESSSDILPPCTIFVDESGSLAFQEPKRGGPKSAFVFVAVAVPTMDFEALLNILPRGRAGGFLKAKDQEFNRQMALRFVDDLIASTAEVGAKLVDPGDPANIALAEKEVRLENEGRARARDKESTEAGKHQHPDITLHDFHYLLFLSMAVFECFSSWALRRQQRSTFVDIVIDSMQIHAHHKSWFSRKFRELLANHNITVRRLEWRREQDEPLLLLPDIFGGILCREDRFRDVGEAATRLWDASRDKRFRFANTAPKNNPD